LTRKGSHKVNDDENMLCVNGGNFSSFSKTEATVNEEAKNTFQV
jgi:hypothetical protein